MEESAYDKKVKRISKTIGQIMRKSGLKSVTYDSEAVEGTVLKFIDPVTEHELELYLSCYFRQDDAHLHIGGPVVEIFGDFSEASDFHVEIPFRQYRSAYRRADVASRHIRAYLGMLAQRRTADEKILDTWHINLRKAFKPLT